MASFRRRPGIWFMKRRTGWELGLYTGFTPGFFDPQAIAAQSRQVSVGTRFVLDGLTLIRVRGAMTVFFQGPQGNASIMLGVGLCIVDERAFNLGAVALPDPIDDAADEMWLWHQFVSLYVINAGIEFQNDGTQAYCFEIDSKA